MRPTSLYVTSMLSMLSSVHARPELMPHEVVTLQPQSPLNSITHHDVLDNQGCRPVTVLFASDTTDDGNVGSSVGPAFFQALSDKFGGRNRISIQGIDYPVAYGVYDEGNDGDGWDPYQLTGGQMMARTAQKVMDDCPSTNLVLSGYGHGARIVHDAASEMDELLLEFVRAVIVFGPRSLSNGIRQLRISRANMGCRRDTKTCISSDFLNKTRLASPTRPQLAAKFVVDRVYELI